MQEKVQTALQQIRPALQADGGDIELVDVKDGTVKVKADRSLRRLPDVHHDASNGRRANSETTDPEVKEVVAV